MPTNGKIEKTTSINGEVVTAVRSVKIDENSQVSSEFKRTFDFTEVTRAQLLKIATRALVIDEQDTYRRATPDKRKAMLVKQVKVLNMLTKKRQKKSDLDKVTALMATMTQVDRDIVLKAHNAK